MSRSKVSMNSRRPAGSPPPARVTVKTTLLSAAPCSSAVTVPAGNGNDWRSACAAGAANAKAPMAPSNAGNARRVRYMDGTPFPSGWVARGTPKRVSHAQRTRPRVIFGEPAHFHPKPVPAWPLGQAARPRTSAVARPARGRLASPRPGVIGEEREREHGDGPAGRCGGRRAPRRRAVGAGCGDGDADCSGGSSEVTCIR
jgi:hypothetical protein